MHLNNQKTEKFSYDVFISHSSKDKLAVRELAERLKADGLRVWFDEWEIKPGDMIGLKIEQGLEQSRTLVLVMSANAFASDWVTLERHTAMFRDPTNAQRRFIPLRLDGAGIKDSLKQFLYVDWRQKSDDHYQKLMTVITEDGATNIQPTSVVEDQKPSAPISPNKSAKSDFLEDRFIKEMDKLVAPLNAKIGNVDIFLKGAPGYKDSRFARHHEYFSFWDKINENKYLCPDYLHSAIENYLNNKTDKVGDRTRDLSYEKAEMELFVAIRKRYSELRSILNGGDQASAKEQFRLLCKNFYSQPIDVRNKTAEQISEIAKEIELNDVLDFWRSSSPGEKVGAAVAIGTHLTISRKNHEDKMIINALRDGLSDSHSRVRYRVIEALGKSEKLVNHFRTELTDISIHDKNSGVRDKAKEVLKNRN